MHVLLKLYSKCRLTGLSRRLNWPVCVVVIIITAITLMIVALIAMTGVYVVADARNCLGQEDSGSHSGVVVSSTQSKRMTPDSERLNQEAGKPGP